MRAERKRRGCALHTAPWLAVVIKRLFTTVANLTGQDFAQLFVPCPPGSLIRLKTVSFNFITDATVATREMTGQIDYGANPGVAALFRLAFPGPVVTASSNIGVTFAVGANAGTTASLVGGAQIREIPDFWSDKAIAFAYDCPNLQAGDVLSSIFLSWEVDDGL